MNYIAVVNTFNRSKIVVEKCLNSILSQRIKPIKLFLIDQNENQVDISNTIKLNPIFSHIQVKTKSISAARNSLQVPPEAEWIFFCDDDGYVDNNYSEILNNLITQNPEIEIFAGSIVRDDNFEFYSLRHKNGGSLKKFKNTKILMGSNFVIKASTFDKLNRFDENFGVGSYWGSSEETDFCWKAYFQKIPMEFFPQLKVYHAPPFNLSIKKGFIKSFKFGIGKGALVYKWLIKNRKLIVSYELIEMFIVPIIVSIIGIFKLKPQFIVTNSASIIGRLYGLIKAIFSKRI